MSGIGNSAVRNRRSLERSCAEPIENALIAFRSSDRCAMHPSGCPQLRWSCWIAPAHLFYRVLCTVTV